MLADLWFRARTWIASVLGRAPLAAGRYETGRKFSWRGMIGTAPLVTPSRDYLLYVPSGWQARGAAPLLILCHGCRQTPEEFAQGSRIAALADLNGCVVLLPRQKDRANPWRCWNWFERRTMHGRGEAAIVAAQIRSIRRRYGIDRRRVLIAGISAGGALAAVIGLRHPRLVRAVAVHSGLACGAASSVFTALAVMKLGPDRDVAAIGAEARLAAPVSTPVVPLLAIHGDADDVVAPRHADALLRQYLRFNGHAAGAGGGNNGEAPPPDVQTQVESADGRPCIVREWRLDGRLIARQVVVAGLGHAWSGGDATLPFNDARPPDATTLVGDFLADVVS